MATLPGPRLLDSEEITRQLRDLPGWLREPLSLRAAYELPDFALAARFVGELAAEAETMDHHPDVDLRWRTVTLRCATHSAGGITQLDVELAHRAREWAQRLGGAPTAPPHRVELALDVADAGAVLPFWREALAYREVTGPDGTDELHDPHGGGPSLWFQPMDPARHERGRFHLDVFRSLPDAVRLRDRLLELGGTLTDDSHAPQWWVLADPEGNECCVCVPDA
jgi:4a-hydroxytetrahydrobiopterin dehydratase